MKTLTYILAQDYASKSPAFWMLLIPKNQTRLVEAVHAKMSQKFFVDDERDPHNQSWRDQGNLVASLKHPFLLSAHWERTARYLVSLGDTLMNAVGGMCPRGSFNEIDECLCAQWPNRLREDLWVDVMTWGNHWYLSSPKMTFFKKYNTSQEAVNAAKRYALSEHIHVDSNPKQPKQGD